MIGFLKEVFSSSKKAVEYAGEIHSLNKSYYSLIHELEKARFIGELKEQNPYGCKNCAAPIESIFCKYCRKKHELNK